jgi:hypothetical protein
MIHHTSLTDVSIDNSDISFGSNLDFGHRFWGGLRFPHTGTRLTAFASVPKFVQVSRNGEWPRQEF